MNWKVFLDIFSHVLSTLLNLFAVEKPCWNKKGLSPNCSPKMLWYALYAISEVNSWKTTQYHNPKLYTWHSAIRKLLLPWQTQNPDSSRQRCVIQHSREHVPAVLESCGGIIYTYPKLYIIKLQTPVATEVIRLIESNGWMATVGNILVCF